MLANETPLIFAKFSTLLRFFSHFSGSQAFTTVEVHNMHSTVSLSFDCEAALVKLARRSHCSKSCIIARLLRNELGRHNRAFIRGSAVQYQPPCKDGLVIVHFFIDPDLYEACLDLRKFLKKICFAYSFRSHLAGIFRFERCK